jgi:uncharacterized iron-regulated membrane protein
MGWFASPGQAALVAAAVGWPLVAGLGVVIWSKRRAALAARQSAELDARVKGLYRTIELREAPERLTLVIDTLEEQAQVEAEAARRAPTRRAPRRKAPQE